MPPHVIVCRHCEQTVNPSDLKWRPKVDGPDRYKLASGDHAIAELEESGPLDSNRKRTVIRRRVLVCLVGLTRWN